VPKTPTFESSRRAAMAWLRVHYPTLGGDHQDLVQRALVARLERGLREPPTPEQLIGAVRDRCREAKRQAAFRGEHVSFESVRSLSEGNG
jgi:hypothetical protein